MSQQSTYTESTHITSRNMVWTSNLHVQDLRDQYSTHKINIHVNDRSFYPYHGINLIVEELDKINILSSDCKNAYNKLMNEWKNTQFSSDSILYSIIRRISRESMSSINLIDNFTQLLKRDMVSYFNQMNQKLYLFIEGSEWLDRPTLRILYHIAKIVPDNILTQAWGFGGRTHFEDFETSFDDITNNIIRARYMIFNKISTDLQLMDINENASDINWGEMKYKSIADNPLSNAALALVTLNYEYGLLTCKSLAKSDDANEELYRILGLIHVNLNHPELAYDSLMTALNITESVSKKAHLKYLCGLLATKRFYDPNLAEKLYDEGLELLRNETEDEEVRLEKAWLFNGISFLDATKGMQETQQRRQELFESTLRRELEALQIIKNDHGKGPLYLKFNLYSNIAFLLEIKKDYSKALEFWENMFAKYSYIESDGGKKADSLYLFRTGMLHWKKEEYDTALDYLQQSSTEAELMRERIFYQLINYSIGYISLQKEDYSQALHAFANGLKVAKSLNDLEMIDKLSKGYLKVSINNHSFDEALAYIKQQFIEENYQIDLLNKNSTDLYDMIQDCDLPSPKTKLPSYYPLFDLEAKPKIDMNSYLIQN